MRLLASLKAMATMPKAYPQEFLSVKTVRFYTDSGLLVSDRSAAGHRRYGPTDLVRLTLIRGLRDDEPGPDEGKNLGSSDGFCDRTNVRHGH